MKLGHSEADAEALRKLASLPNVEKLGLEGCQASRRQSARSTRRLGRTLKFLDVQETKVTAKGVGRFRSLRPDVKVLAGPFEARVRQEAR